MEGYALYMPCDGRCRIQQQEDVAVFNIWCTRAQSQSLHCMKELMALEGLQLWSRRLLGVLLSGETEAWTAMVGGNQHALVDATDRDGAVLTNGGERRNTDHLNKGLDPKYHLFLFSDPPSYSSFLCH